MTKIETEADLKAIEARREKAMNEFWPETPKRCQVPIKQDIPALTAALREAWEERAKLERIADTQTDLLKAYGILRAPNDEQMKWARQVAKDKGLR